MATIQYTTYRFIIPQILVEKDYEIMKEVLTINPNHSITPPSSFFETFKGEIIFLGIGALGGIISSLNGPEWLEWVGGIPAILAIFSLFSFVPSMFSYLGFLSDKSSYYQKLKRDIIKSNSYNEFINIRKGIR